jgi:hypothetical protein
MTQQIEPNPWLILFVSAISGGAVGAVISVIYHWISESITKISRERASINSLIAELKRCKSLCDYNSELKEDPIGPFIQFPVITANEVTFRNRYYYPKLNFVQDDLVHCTMGLLQVNQLIDLHKILWSANEEPRGHFSGASVEREKIRREIAEICAGTKNITKVGPNDFIFLPQYISSVIAKIEKI